MYNYWLFLSLSYFYSEVQPLNSIKGQTESVMSGFDRRYNNMAKVFLQPFFFDPDGHLLSTVVMSS